MVVIIIYLFVLDDSLTIKRVTKRTEQITKCRELLQKMRVRLGTCESGLSPPVIKYYRSFHGDASFVVLIVLCFGVELLCCLHLTCMYIFI